MIRFLGASVLAVMLAVPASADPAILVPECSGQVPEPGQCTAGPPESANPLDGVFGDAPGGNPNIQVGLTPQSPPVVLPLGLTPVNLPAVMPLGITPPNVSGR